MGREATLHAARTDQLDGLRFFAFAAVFFSHLPSPQHPWLFAVQIHGWVGVELFFALSSFLLFRLFMAEHERTGSIRIGQFFARRMLRIYPLMVLFPLAMILIFGPDRPIAWGWIVSQFAFVGNYVLWATGNGVQVPYTDHFWTLSYEFQVYLVLPALFLTYLAVGKRAFITGLLVLVPICLLARASFGLAGASWQAVYMTPLLRPESVIIGLLLALGVWRSVRTPTVMLVLIASGTGMLLMPPLVSLPGKMFATLIAAIFAGATLHLALNSRLFANVLQFPPFAYLGRISFGLYVFHPLAIMLGARLVKAAGAPDTYGMHVLTALGICIVFATISYYAFEVHLLRMKPRGGRPITSSPANPGQAPSPRLAPVPPAELPFRRARLRS